MDFGLSGTKWCPQGEVPLHAKKCILYMLPGHKHIQMAKVKESNFYLCLEEEYSKCFKVF